MTRTLSATRYVTALREGGSLPGLVEAEDDGLYVVKLRGAGQGPKALIAELLAGGIGERLGLQVPERVFLELDVRLSRTEPDPEIRELLKASAGLNLALDYLPGSITFDPLVGPAPDATLASRGVLFDAFITNIDRTAKNPNLLRWHQELWFIDHGASLHFQHRWEPDRRLEGADSVFAAVRQHVLLRWASALPAAAAELDAKVDRPALDALCASIPESWLEPADDFVDADAQRAAYANWLWARKQALPAFLEEAERAHAQCV